MLEKIHLNDRWHFKEVFEEEDLTPGKAEGFLLVDLPHTNKITPLNNFDERISHTVSIYKRTICAEDLTCRYRLIFEGVAHYGKLFVNGVFAAEHRCGYTRWTIDITPFLKQGSNEIAVVVDSTESDQPPFGFVIDYLCFGGIYRECYMEKLHRNHIEDLYFHYDRDTWTLDYTLAENFDGFIELEVRDHRAIIHEKVRCGEALHQRLPEVHLWDIDDPYLYRLALRLIGKDGTVFDICEQTIGFRYAEFRENGFFLNGRHVKLRGTNRHQSYPYVGYAMPKRAQQEDADLIRKDLQMNAVRTSHYPQSPDFLNRCDEIGLLVFEEIPGWQHIGDNRWKEIALSNVKEMILRDRHHPSIILWGVRINESRDDHAFYTRTNALAHLLDPYRPTGGVRCLLHSELLEDVYTYNDFICGGHDKVLRKKAEVTDSAKPYLISEYGGHMFPTKPFDNEIRRTEAASIHSRILQAAAKDDQIAGTFAWCFADYNTHYDFGSGDLVCYHGIMDLFRNPKYTAMVYRRFRKEPFLDVTSNFNIGEHNGGYIRSFMLSTNCDAVEMIRNGMVIHTFSIRSVMDDGCFLIDDLIGNLLVACEGKTEEESDRIKAVIQEILSYDGILREELSQKYGSAFLEEAWMYYGKYVSNWGSHASPYTFIGYRNGKKAIEIRRGGQYIDHLAVSCSTEELCSVPTYDVARITVEAIGSNNNRTDYAFDSFVVETTGGVEVIGESCISLIAGVRSFYIRSTVPEGTGKVRIRSERFGTTELTFTIRNEEKQ